MFEHGLVAEADGWEAQYWICGPEDLAPDAMVLALVRRFPLSTGMVWIVGGPAGDSAAFDGEFLGALREENGFSRCYLRTRVDAELNGLSSVRMGVQGFRPVIHRMGSGLTVQLDLSKEFEKGLSHTWKRSLKKAVKNGLKVYLWENPDASAMRALFAGLEKQKGLGVLFSEEKLEKLSTTEGLNLQIFRCDDAEGNLLALRGQIVIGTHAVDYMAVTSDRGRELCASHLIIKEVCASLKLNGVKTFELGGIDPDKNPGVTRFKVETGARKVIQLGEWDMATSAPLRIAGNLAIKLRNNMEASIFRGFIDGITTRKSQRPEEIREIKTTKGVQAC